MTSGKEVRVPTERELELFLQEKILPDLDKGRPTDKPHTLFVVSKLKEILDNSPEIKVDTPVLIISTYAHDWGYTDLFDHTKVMDLASIGSQKEAHMLAGAAKLTSLLNDSFFDFLTPERKHRAIHLVLVHDKMDQLKEPDELVLMEADSLGGLEPDIMGTFPDQTSEERFMRKSRELRLSRFITDYGKEEFERLFEKRKQFYKKLAK